MRFLWLPLFAAITAMAGEPSSPETCRISYWSQGLDSQVAKVAGHCSATLVNSSGDDALVTAGHCKLSNEEITKFHIIKTTVSCPNSDIPADREERKVIVNLSQMRDYSPPTAKEARDLDQDLMVIRAETPFKAQSKARLAKDSAEEVALLNTQPTVCFRAGFDSLDPKSPNYLSGSFQMSSKFTFDLNPAVDLNLSPQIVRSYPSLLEGDSGGGLICTASTGERVLVAVTSGTDDKFANHTDSERVSYSARWLKYALGNSRPINNDLFQQMAYASDYCVRGQNCFNTVSKQGVKLTIEMKKLLAKLEAQYHQTLMDSMSDTTLKSFEKSADSLWDIFSRCYNLIQEKIAAHSG